MEPHDRLKEARIKAGFASAAEAASALDVSESTYTQHENGTRSFRLKAEKYAKRFATTPEWLLYGRGAGVASAPIPVTRTIPVLGKVQAGLFELIVDEPEPSEYVPLVLPGYDGASLYALWVAGPSMNQVYPEGSMVIVCPVQEIGVRDEDHVIVRRTRNGEVETTIKEVVQERGGIALWPRSDDPAFQTPFRLKRDGEADDGYEIIGVVVSGYTVRPQRRRPLLRL